jgi:uncharacterized protein (DUF488 family)
MTTQTPADQPLPSTSPPLGMLYTLGYSATGAVRLVEHLVALDVTIVDIRLRADSVRPLWERGTLSAWLGKYYWHQPALGNMNYARHGQPIMLADPEVGLPKLVLHLAQGESLALLCVCAEVEQCHRRLVADLVQARLPGLRVIHLLTSSTPAHQQENQ